MPPAGKKQTEDFEIDPEYVEQHFPEGVPPGFQKAYNHAMLNGNTERASQVYADAHYHEDYFAKE